MLGREHVLFRSQILCRIQFIIHEAYLLKQLQIHAKEWAGVGDVADSKYIRLTRASILRMENGQPLNDLRRVLDGPGKHQWIEFKRINNSIFIAPHNVYITLRIILSLDIRSLVIIDNKKDIAEVANHNSSHYLREMFSHIGQYFMTFYWKLTK